MKFVKIRYEHTDSGDDESIHVNDVCVSSGNCNQVPEALEAIENTFKLTRHCI